MFFRGGKRILLNWKHPASKERSSETEEYQSRHPEDSRDLLVTKKLVVEGVQLEDSGLYSCQARFSLIQRKTQSKDSDIKMQAHSNECPGKIRESKPPIKIEVGTEEHLSVDFK